MKILVYPHDLNMGGSQTNAIELAAAVSKLGHECVVFGRRGTLCARIEELGLEFIESPDPGRRPSPRVARALQEVVRERGIDVIHGYEWPPGLEGWLAAERLPDVAAVCTVMSMAVAPFLPRWMPLVVGTQQISAREQEAGRLSVNLIEPPVDLEHNRIHDPATVAAFRNAWDLDERPLVVTVSRLVRELKSEGVLTAIEAAVTMQDATPFQLVIVGDGQARDEIQRAADEANARLGRRTVTLTGELSDPRAAYGAADVMLGMGGSALRSLAFAKPLVVQGELGYFRTLTRESLSEFRWQGWYGIGAGRESGLGALEAELAPLLADETLRRELGALGREVVEEFSLESAAKRQVTVYRDALAARGEHKKQVVDAARSSVQLAHYYVGQRVARIRGRQRTDDFNAEPVASHSSDVTANGLLTGEPGRPTAAGPILWFPGVGWDTLAGTDRQLATAIAQHSQIVWVDTPHSILRRRDRIPPAVSEPIPNVVRLRAPTLAGVQRPFLRDLANRRRAAVARRYLEQAGLRPSAVIASTTAPMLHHVRDLGGRRAFYATDDFVEGAPLWGVSKRYLAAAREKNLRAADVVLAVTPELARHLQRTPHSPRWLPNGADVTSLTAIDTITPAEVPLEGPVAGVVGQFNARTDLALLDAVRTSGTSLLLVGPRWFVNSRDDEAFDRLVSSPGVHWVDGLPRDELAPYLAALDVGLTPYADSMFNRRSYPLKTVEYLAAGVPVVSSDVAPLSGLDRAYVSAESDVDEFCARVAKVAASHLDRSDVRRSVTDAGWDSRAERLLAMLHDDSAQLTPDLAERPAL